MSPTVYSNAPAAVTGSSFLALHELDSGAKVELLRQCQPAIAGRDNGYPDAPGPAVDVGQVSDQEVDRRDTASSTALPGRREQPERVACHLDLDEVSSAGRPVGYRPGAKQLDEALRDGRRRLGDVEGERAQAHDAERPLGPPGRRPTGLITRIAGKQRGRELDRNAAQVRRVDPEVPLRVCLRDAQPVLPDSLFRAVVALDSKFNGK